MLEERRRRVSGSRWAFTRGGYYADMMLLARWFVHILVAIRDGASSFAANYATIGTPMMMHEKIAHYRPFQMIVERLPREPGAPRTAGRRISRSSARMLRARPFRRLLG